MRQSLLWVLSSFTQKLWDGLRVGCASRYEHSVPRSFLQHRPVQLALSWNTGCELQSSHEHIPWGVRIKQAMQQKQFAWSLCLSYGKKTSVWKSPLSQKPLKKGSTQRKFWTAFYVLWNSSGFPGVAERAALDFCGLVHMQLVPRVCILV